jgi:hypothetical protein
MSCILWDADARFSSVHGMCPCPFCVRAWHGWDVLVCCTPYVVESLELGEEVLCKGAMDLRHRADAAPLKGLSWMRYALNSS